MTPMNTDNTETTTYTCNGVTHSCATWNWTALADAVWEGC